MYILFEYLKLPGSTKQLFNIYFKLLLLIKFSRKYMPNFVLEHSKHHVIHTGDVKTKTGVKY